MSRTHHLRKHRHRWARVRSILDIGDRVRRVYFKCEREGCFAERMAREHVAPTKALGHRYEGSPR